jgi:hypothetical protein
MVEFYKQTSVERHGEIVVSGDRLFFENEEYVIDSEEELRLVRSSKKLEQRLVEIEMKLDIG